jgi:hypothetical protein
MLGSTIANSVNAAIELTPLAKTETFESQSGIGVSPFRSAFVTFFTVSIIFILILLFGKYLWNNVLHVLVPGVKKADSILQIFGIALLISMLHPGSCTCA